VDETGLSPEAIVELILKTLYVQGARSGQELVDTIRLPFPIVDEQVLKLQHHRLVEVKRTVGAGRGGYIFDLTGTGAERAREAMAAGQYVGPAPVPLEHYRTWVERQSVRNVHVTRERLVAAFSGLVLNPAFIDIAANNHMGGSQVTTTVVFVPVRNRQGEQVDVFSFQHIF
jgi:hypothetical protein